MHIESSLFLGNEAGRGGAIALVGSGPKNIKFKESIQFIANTATTGGGGAIYWQGDEPDFDGLNERGNLTQWGTGNKANYGDFVGSAAKLIKHMPPSPKIKVTNTKPFAPVLVLVDFYQNIIVDWASSSSITLQATSTTSQPFGNLYALVNKNGIAVFNDFGIAASPGIHEISVQASSATVASLSFNVLVEECLSGEFLSNKQGVFACNLCEPGYYTNIKSTGATRVGLNPTSCLPVLGYPTRVAFLVRFAHKMNIQTKPRLCVAIQSLTKESP